MIKFLLLLVTGIAARATPESTSSSFNPNTGSYCPSSSHHYKPTNCWEHCDWKHYSSCSDGEWKKDHHRCIDGKKHEFWCDRDQRWKHNKKECFKKCEKKCDKPIWKDDCKKWDDHKHCFVPCQNISISCPQVCTSHVVVAPSSQAAAPSSQAVAPSSQAVAPSSQAVAPVNAVAVSCPPCATITTQVPAPLRCNTVVICNPVLNNCPRPTGTVTFTLAPSSSASA